MVKGNQGASRQTLQVEGGTQGGLGRGALVLGKVLVVEIWILRGMLYRVKGSSRLRLFRQEKRPAIMVLQEYVPKNRGLLRISKGIRFVYSSGARHQIFNGQFQCVVQGVLWSRDLY